MENLKKKEILEKIDSYSIEFKKLPSNHLSLPLWLLPLQPFPSWRAYEGIIEQA